MERYGNIIHVKTTGRKVGGIFIPIFRRNGNEKESSSSINQKLEEITWKDDSLWYLTRPITDEDVAETHTFQQQSNFGVFEGTVTIIESKE